MDIFWPYKIKIGIIGVGMVGSQLLRWFLKNNWERGKNLFCFDSDSKKNFNDDAQQAVLLFICLPTPSAPDGSCDTSLVEGAVEKFQGKDKVLVIRSTISLGTLAAMARKYPDCRLFSYPEFLTEANPWNDFINPDRQIVAPAMKYKDDGKIAKSILSLLPIPRVSSLSLTMLGDDGDLPHCVVNATEAELAKYGANLFGAMKVCFANIVADLCHGLEALAQKEPIGEKVDYNKVKTIIASDRRIGNSWLDIYHGNYRGFGGFCFPKDLDGLIASVKKISQGLNEKDPKGSQIRNLIARGIIFLEAIRDYNIELLKAQGLTLSDVCRHDKELEEVIKKKKGDK